LKELLLVIESNMKGIFGDNLDVMSPLILLYLRVGRSRILSLSSYDLFSKLEINLAAHFFLGRIRFCDLDIGTVWVHVV